MQTFIKFIAILGIFLLQACGQAYHKSFYERISEIKIPENASIIETVDNCEFMTVTTFKVTPSDIVELHRKYKFEAVNGSFVPDFLGNSILKGPKPANSDLNKCLMKIQQNGSTYNLKFDVATTSPISPIEPLGFHKIIGMILLIPLFLNVSIS